MPVYVIDGQHLQHLGSLSFSSRKVHAPNEEKVMFKAMTKVDDDLRSLLRSLSRKAPGFRRSTISWLSWGKLPRRYVYLPYYSHGREVPVSVAV